MLLTLPFPFSFLQAHAADSVKPRPNAAAEPHDGLKGPVSGGLGLGSGTRSGGEGGSAATPAASSANAPRRPNDKLASIKHKTGGLLPHERSDSTPSA